MRINDFGRAYVAAQAYAGNHRRELERDRICGCFHCLTLFEPNQICQWLESDHGDAQGTALCPHCGKDAVIGESSGYPITEEFLKQMKEFWFAQEEEEE